MIQQEQMDGAVPCPRCAGSGRTHIAVSTGVGGYISFLALCRTCDGIGQITEQASRWIKLGQQKRDARVSCCVSLRKRAEQLGISPIRLNAMECGREDPTMLLLADVEGDA